MSQREILIEMLKTAYLVGASDGYICGEDDGSIVSKELMEIFDSKEFKDASQKKKIKMLEGAIK